MATKPPYRLLYNNDATNTAGVISPWHQGGEVELVYIDLFIENPPIRKAIGALTGE